MQERISTQLETPSIPNSAPFEPGAKLKSCGILMPGHICVYQSMSARDRVRVLFEGKGFRFVTDVPLDDVEPV